MVPGQVWRTDEGVITFLIICCHICLIEAEIVRPDEWNNFFIADRYDFLGNGAWRAQRGHNDLSGLENITNVSANKKIS